MHWRCLNNVFNYCSEPEFSKDELVEGTGIVVRTCPRDPKACSKRLTFSQVTKHEFSQEKPKAKGKKA